MDRRVNILDNEDTHGSKTRKICRWVPHWLQMGSFSPFKVIDGTISYIFQFNLYIYWIVAGRYPTFIEQYVRNTHRRIIDCHRQELSEKDEKIKDLEKEKDELIQDKISLENEKQDALRRLSEVVSAKLRDNNPNIVDLNDQCRPTKLAEMFSELYDNEWTSAFTVLENHFGDKHAIVFLLDITMKSYAFCEERVAMPWNIVITWFLDMNLPGAQQTSKWLKDSRKANIRSKVPEVTNDFKKEVLSRCQGNALLILFEKEEINKFVTKCTELCLLMVTTDPPVFIECPGWSDKAFGKIWETLDETTADIKKKENNRNTTQLCETKTESKETKTEMINANESTTTERRGDVEFDSKRAETERLAFNKDLFKEYTVRGPYLDYVVWPTLFLYKDGPLLSKGIAQGSKQQYREPNSKGMVMSENSQDV